MEPCMVPSTHRGGVSRAQTRTGLRLGCCSRWTLGLWGWAQIFQHFIPSDLRFHNSMIPLFWFHDSTIPRFSNSLIPRFLDSMMMRMVYSSRPRSAPCRGQPCGCCWRVCAHLPCPWCCQSCPTPDQGLQLPPWVLAWPRGPAELLRCGG